MTPKRWRRIEDLFDAARRRPANERAAFLDDACGSDVTLRAEIESLLAHDHSGESLLDAAETAAAYLLSVGDLIGRTIGRYRVLSLLGVGGMGEVYLAADVRLGRNVAIKVLPASLMADPARRARFEREARVLASFRHPHIGAIHGIEEFEGRQVLVLEYVEGETLDERLRNGPLRISEAIAIARQIADAIDTAHEQDIVHRDLKPVNVKVAPNGRVSVLDFGLAMAVVGDVSGPDLSSLPAMASAGTALGTIAGTPRYMSPEQARGQRVDKRTDIWSFGCLFYELLTGRVAFPGDTVADTVAAVIEREPDWKALPAATPPSIRRLLQRCLEKDPARRLRDIGDARLELEDAQAGSREPHAHTSPGLPAATRTGSGRTLALVLTTFGAAALLSAAVYYIRTPESRTGQIPVQVLTITAPPGTRLNDLTGLAVSADGSTVAFVADGDLWVRPVGGGSARRLVPGANIAQAPPVWSPDGRVIGFYSNGTLRTVAADGGIPVEVVQAPSRGAAFVDQATILLGAEIGPIRRVELAGGTPLNVTSLIEGDTGHRWPSMLPDGDHFLYMAMRSDGHQLRVGSLSSSTTVSLGPSRSQGVYASGFVLFLNAQGNLMARPFDVNTLGFTGPPHLVAGQTALNAWGLAAFSASHNGPLAHVEGGGRSRLTWISRSGAPNPIGEPGWHFNLALSPDGGRVAVSMMTGPPANVDIWVFDLARGGSPTRVTFDRDMEFDPAWHPDGKRLVFNSNRVGGSFRLFERPANGEGEDRLIVRSELGHSAPNVSKDGRHLLFNQVARAGGSELWTMPLGGNGIPTVFVGSPGSTGQGSFSPDGRWVAYQSSASGRNEIYIRAFPDGQSLVQVSRGGGRAVQWRGDGREVFFLDAEAKLMAAGLSMTGDSISPAEPVPLFETALGAGNARPYAARSDGQAFLLPVPLRSSPAPTITVLLDWPSRARR